MKKILCVIALGMLFFTSCDESAEEVDCSAITLSVNITDVTHATCISGGSVTFSISNGQEPYEYSINGTSFSSSNTFEALNGGAYTLTIRDDNQCTVQYDFEVEEDEGISSIETQILQSAQGCGGTSGSILVSASSANEGELQYSIDGGDFRDTSRFDGLPNGDHTINVLDAFGCEETVDVYVPSEISYESSIKTIIETNCAISGCHVAGTSRVNFNILSNVQSEASNIASRTASGSMPPNSSDLELTDEEVEAIACWINDGAVDN